MILVRNAEDRDAAVLAQMNRRFNGSSVTGQQMAANLRRGVGADESWNSAPGSDEYPKQRWKSIVRES